jgi:hypothetical protein
MKTKPYMLLLAFSLVLSSCATLVTQTSWPVSVNSQPPAKLRVTDSKGRQVFSGTTPANLNLKSGEGYFKKARYTLTMAADGYDTLQVPLKATFNKWYLGNILFSGLVGFLVVDPVTGAAFRIDQPEADYVLVKSTAYEVTRLKVFQIHNMPDDWKRQVVDAE